MIEISPSGQGLHVPALDADLWLPTLLDGLTGSRSWQAVRLGRESGEATTSAKAAAAAAAAEGDGGVTSARHFAPIAILKLKARKGCTSTSYTHTMSRRRHSQP